jgi:hypothetical protein
MAQATRPGPAEKPRRKRWRSPPRYVRIMPRSRRGHPGRRLLRTALPGAVADVWPTLPIRSSPLPSPGPFPFAGPLSALPVPGSSCTG